MPPSSSPAPEIRRPDPDWAHAALYERVIDAVGSLPFYFQTDTSIEGISATDIFTLNSALGATIEEQVVSTLNRLRTVWDPDEEYATCGFVRQSQCFPDVLLRDSGNAADAPIMGIELKGWYLLSKEAEPSARFRVTPEACAPADLLVVVPWALQHVLSGAPKVLSPFVAPARYAAEVRNHHWRHVRKARSDTSIHSPRGVTPYPSKTDHITDRPASDAGGNFGRFSRCGIMDAFLTATLAEPLCGIPASAWLAFFRVFTDTVTAEEARARIDVLRANYDLRSPASPGSPEAVLCELLDWIESHLAG